MEQLLDVLRYKREVMQQLLLVATIFGGFAVSGIMAFLGTADRGKLRGVLFVILSVAAFAFIAATILDAVMLPAMLHEKNLRSPDGIRGLLTLGDVVVWSVLVGCLALAAGVGCSGFLFSRRVGKVVAGVAVQVILIVSVSITYLAIILR